MDVINPAYVSVFVTRPGVHLQFYHIYSQQTFDSVLENQSTFVYM